MVLVNVTGKPLVASSLIPVVVDAVKDGVCVAYCLCTNVVFVGIEAGNALL